MRNYPKSLLDPAQCTVAIIDHQPQMYFGVESMPRYAIENSVVGLSKAAQLFNVPCLLTTVEAQTFSGPLYTKVQSLYPEVVPIDRTAINAWEDANFKKAVQGTQRKRIVIAGLWTEACVTFPALCMLEDGYEVFVAVDACGGASQAAHDMSILRMTQAGVKPMTWMQIMLEWQRDWNNKETYNGVLAIVKEHGGAYGLGIEYSESMVKK
ncbi:MAG: hydrolase [Peptococcaceae bacterium]|jgi:nicotinamidase-related amidase|nr:hydrolase [Peptococcaceae bacterium]MDR2736237.1 hydrolase [Gracilibacteraceae bacterium]